MNTITQLKFCLASCLRHQARAFSVSIISSLGMLNKQIKVYNIITWFNDKNSYSLHKAVSGALLCCDLGLKHSQNSLFSFTAYSVI